jgi:two-component system phosphate regulon sensor histidine kinase PhoR
LIVNAAPLALAARGGGTSGVVAVFSDVTELHRLERARRDFVVNASHELRTPVAAIHASSETLLAGALADPEAAQEFVEAIDRNAARLRRLVDELLDLSRIEAMVRPLSLAPLDLAEQAEATTSLLRARADAKRTAVELQIAPATMAIADAGALEQILTNLLENAITHTPPGSHVTVRARVTGGRAILEVEDDGPGIPPPHRDRVFERFYRVDPGRSRDSGGTGLGLSIARHLAEAMHGELVLAGGAMGGALFRLTLHSTRGSRPLAPLGKAQQGPTPRDPI